MFIYLLIYECDDVSIISTIQKDDVSVCGRYIYLSRNVFGGMECLSDYLNL